MYLFIVHRMVETKRIVSKNVSVQHKMIGAVGYVGINTIISGSLGSFVMCMVVLPQIRGQLILVSRERG